jgi:radical SAM protein with 4Fe4S-binding SPASM domain
MCPRDIMTRPKGYMAFELFKKIVDQTKGCTEWLWLHHMGDPMLHPKVGDFIRYAKSKGIKTRLSTNPVCLTDKKVKEILDAGLDFIHISLDGMDNETYKLLRGKNADYEKAVKNTERLLDTKRKLGLKTPVVRMGIIRMKKTENSVDKFKEFWLKRGVNEIEIKDFRTWDGSIKEIIDLAGEENLSKEFKHQKKFSCRQPWLHLVFLWDGRVVPCCYDYDGKYVIGDLNKESLESIWNNKSMLRLRQQQKSNNFEGNQLCASCKEREGSPPSKFYPFNMYTFKTIFNLSKNYLRGIFKR